MPHLYRRYPLGGEMPLALLFSLGLVACGEPGSWLVLELQGLTGDLRSIRPKVTLDDGVVRVLAPLPAPPLDKPKIGLRMPNGYQGGVHVTIDGIPAGTGEARLETDRWFVRSKGVTSTSVGASGRTDAIVPLTDELICDENLLGACWVPFATPSARPLVGIWAFSPTNVWALPQAGPAWRWDGVAWEAQREMPWRAQQLGVVSDIRFVDLWAFSPDDIWFLNRSGDIAHLLGEPGRWETVAGPYLKGDSKGIVPGSIAGLRPDRMWSAGYKLALEGAISRWNGTTWVGETVPSGTPLLTDLWAGGGEAWAVGDKCTILRRANADGEGDWSRETVPCSTEGLTSIWGPGGGELWAVGAVTLHRTGGTWIKETVADGARLRSVHGSSAEDVWAVGEQGTRYHRTQGSWVPDGPNAAEADLLAVFSQAPDDVWAVGTGGRVLHRDSSRWSVLTGGVPSIKAMWGSGPNDIWAAGWAAGASDQDQILHFDGQSWARQTLPRPGIRALWGSGPDDVWAAGANGVLHYDGTTWKVVPDLPPWWQDINALWGSGPDDVWAVGAAGLAVHWDGKAWSAPVDTGTDKPLYAIHGTGRADVWAVGGPTAPMGSMTIVVTHYDGTRWALSPNDLTGDNGTFGASVWVTAAAVHVGGGRVIGRLARGQGTWMKLTDARAEPVFGLWGSGPSDFWAVSRTESILRYDGQQWQVPERDTMALNLPDRTGTRSLRAVFGTDASNVFFAGDFGALLRYRPGDR